MRTRPRWPPRPRTCMHCCFKQQACTHTLTHNCAALAALSRGVHVCVARRMSEHFAKPGEALTQFDIRSPANQMAWARRVPLNEGKHFKCNSTHRWYGFSVAGHGRVYFCTQRSKITQGYVPCLPDNADSAAAARDCIGYSLIPHDHRHPMLPKGPAQRAAAAGTSKRPEQPDSRDPKRSKPEATSYALKSGLRVDLAPATEERDGLCPPADAAPSSSRRSQAAAAGSDGLVPPSSTDSRKIAQLETELAQTKQLLGEAREQLAASHAQVQEARDTATHNAATAKQFKNLGLQHLQRTKELDAQVSSLQQALQAAEATEANLRQQLLDSAQPAEEEEGPMSSAEEIAMLRKQLSKQLDLNESQQVDLRRYREQHQQVLENSSAAAAREQALVAQVAQLTQQLTTAPAQGSASAQAAEVAEKLRKQRDAHKLAFDKVKAQKVEWQQHCVALDGQHEQEKARAARLVTKVRSLEETEVQLKERQRQLEASLTRVTDEHKRLQGKAHDYDDLKKDLRKLREDHRVLLEEYRKRGTALDLRDIDVDDLQADLRAARADSAALRDSVASLTAANDELDRRLSELQRLHDVEHLERKGAQRKLHEVKTLNVKMCDDWATAYKALEKQLKELQADVFCRANVNALIKQFVIDALACSDQERATRVRLTKAAWHSDRHKMLPVLAKEVLDSFEEELEHQTVKLKSHEQRLKDWQEEEALGRGTVISHVLLFA